MHSNYKEQEEREEHWFGDWVTRDEEEDAERYDRLRIPSRKLGWSKDNKLFGIRKRSPHGWDGHTRR